MLKLTVAFSAPMIAAGALAASPTPLLDYALSQTFDLPPRDFAYNKHLTSLEHELEQNPPPQKDCAATLGAKRFAAIYGDLGIARSNLANYEGAVEAFEKALACEPRAPYLYAELAAELIHLNRYIEARTTAEQGLEMDDGEDSLNRILAQLDYIEEHWTESAEHLRKAVVATEDNDTAAYWQCLLWLAQRRAGIARPQLVSRESAEHWPQPVLATLTGDMTESALVSSVQSEREAARRREILEEALFYLGQRRLADAEMDDARRYLAAAVNLKVHYFIEHHLALAELAKFRARMTAATPSNARQRP